MTCPQILVAGLDVQCSHRVCHAFELEGFETLAANAGGLTEVFRAATFDVIVFDQATAGGAVRTLLDRRSADAGAPPFTLALVAAGDDDLALSLLEQGVDAFLLQPIGLLELVARTRSLLRRRFPPAGGLEVDVDRRRARLRGEPLTLTEQEFQLLHLLARHPGRVFNRETLLTTLWGGQTFVAERTVDALVKRLRQRLDAPGAGGAYIQTVRGVGYRLAESPSAPRIFSGRVPSVMTFGIASSSRSCHRPDTGRQHSRRPNGRCGCC